MFLFSNVLVTEKTELRYRQHYMLYLPLFLVVTYADCYLSMKNKKPTLYVISSCFSRHFNSLIQINKSWKKYVTSNVIFTLGEHRYTDIYFSSYIVDTMLASILFFKYFGSWKIERRYIQHCMLAFMQFLVFTSTDYYSLLKGKYPIFYVSSSCFSQLERYCKTEERRAVSL